MTRLALTLVTVTVLALPLAAQNRRAVIVQTNSAGDNIHLIDAATNKVVGEINGIEVNHGAAAAPDGTHLYITNEAEHRLDVVDTKTLKVSGHVPLSDRPNNLSISKDGKRVYVAIVAQPGAVDVIDTATLQKIKTIPTKGGIHNTFVTPDGKFVIAGSIVGRLITVIDSNTNEPVWTMPFDNGVRPIAFETNPDGSTKRIFVELSNFNGFVTVDFASRKVVDKIPMPEVAASEKTTVGLQGSPCHGLAVTPDGKTLTVLSKMNSRVYFVSLPDLKIVGETKVGHHPDWITLTPDGKRAYVANAGSNSVSVVDIATRKELTQIPVGQVPKRNITAVLP